MKRAPRNEMSEGNFDGKKSAAIKRLHHLDDGCMTQNESRNRILLLPPTNVSLQRGLSQKGREKEGL